MLDPPPGCSPVSLHPGWAPLALSPRGAGDQSAAAGSASKARKDSWHATGRESPYSVLGREGQGTGMLGGGHRHPPCTQTKSSWSAMKETGCFAGGEAGKSTVGCSTGWGEPLGTPPPSTTFTMPARSPSGDAAPPDLGTSITGTGTSSRGLASGSAGATSPHKAPPATLPTPPPPHAPGLLLSDPLCWGGWSLLMSSALSQHPHPRRGPGRCGSPLAQGCRGRRGLESVETGGTR